MKKLWVPLSSNQWNQNLLIKEENNSNRRRRLQQTKKKGQSMGYGTHYATIFTAFLCKGCEGCCDEHHTDRYFDPEASTTFIALTHALPNPKSIDAYSVKRTPRAVRGMHTNRYLIVVGREPEGA